MGPRGVGERCYGTCPPHAERVAAMMMCRQRVAATKIDSPVMAVSGRHLRLEHGKVCDTDEVDGDPHILQFLSRWHTQTGEVAMMHTAAEKSIGARDRVRDLRGMARFACFTTRKVATQPPNHPPQPQPRTSSPYQISNPDETVIYRNSRTCTQVPYLTF